MINFTYFNDEEKLETLVYMSEHRLSDDEKLQNKQIEIIGIFLEYSIKECDYEGMTCFEVEKKSGVYCFEWMNDHPSMQYYEEGLREIIEPTDKYISIVGAIGKKMSTQRYISDEQRFYQKYFIRRNMCVGRG